MTASVVFALASAIFVVAQNSSPSAPQCASLDECHRMAIEAADRQDYEAFHDLAWRAVQKAPKNDAGTMTMLARAQSLSGRPHDALVMLRRLAAMGVVTDAGTNDDFRRVRALPGWADFERSIAESAAPVAPDSRAVAATPRVAPRATPEKPPEKATPIPPGAIPEVATPEPKPVPPKPSSEPEAGGKRNKVSDESAASASAERVAGDAADAVRFTTPTFIPAGMAYDHISGRFIFGDRDGRKLTVIGENSQLLVNLIGAQSGGFGEIDALEIDPREGDLWVVSTGADDRAALHKLQLISGRALYAVPLDEGLGAARFADVAVTPRSTVLVLDASGRRLFRAAPKSRALELAVKVDRKGLASVAPVSDSIAYVAHDEGLVRVDLAARRVRNVADRTKADLSRLSRIRWHRGALIGIQKPAGGTINVVRIRLDGAGTSATALDVLQRDVSMTSPTAAALSGDDLYYLVSSPSSGSGIEFAIVRRLSLK